jgi:hypothetical protein
VDNVAIATRPAEYMYIIEQEFLVQNKEDISSLNLGNDFLHVSNKTYIKESRKEIPRRATNTSKEEHTNDSSDLLDNSGIGLTRTQLGLTNA